MAKHSKATLARFPTFRDWVLGNLTVAQIEAMCEAQRGSLWFGDDHPLNCEDIAMEVFRAYRSEVVGQLEYQFVSLGHFGMIRGYGATRAQFHHHALIVSIVFMTMEHPEVIEEARRAEAVAAERREIDAAADTSKQTAAPAGAIDKRGWL